MQTSTTSLAERLAVDAGDRGAIQEQFVASFQAELDGLLTLVSAKESILRSDKRIDSASPEFHALTIIQCARYAKAGALCAELLDTRSTAFSVAANETEPHFSFFPFATAAAAIGTYDLAARLFEIVAEADPTSTRFQLSCLVLKQVLGETLVLAAIAADDKRQSDIERFVRMPIDRWRATDCSDFTIF